MFVKFFLQFSFRRTSASGIQLLVSSNSHCPLPTQVFNLWKEDYKSEGFLNRETSYKQELQKLHATHAAEKAELQDNHEEEKKLQAKSRARMFGAYLSEKLAPAAYSKSMLTEGFTNWKEAQLKNSFLQREQKLLEKKALEQKEDLKLLAEEQKEKKKQRSAVLCKYLAEKVSPQLYEKASIKGSWSAWKEESIHEMMGKRHRDVHEELQRRKEREWEVKQELEEEFKREHALHTKSRSDMMIKYYKLHDIF
jgi:hypothetical protein